MSKDAGERAAMKIETNLKRDGYLLRELARAGLAAISANRDLVNALNVFPVPDGDTGTNMMLTMRSISQEMDAKSTADVSATAEQMSRAALLGARGNSGLIMAQLFRGLEYALKDAEEVDAQRFAQGLKRAAEMAYDAVPDPKEGTMLTVLREMSEACTEKSSDPDTTLLYVVSTAAAQAMNTVERTPEMLDVLKEAGVVDSGGLGLAIMLLGMEQVLREEGDGSVVVAPPGISADFASQGGVAINANFIDAAEEEMWGYCTVFAIQGEALEVDEIRTQMESIGRSPVVAGDDRLVKVHVHMEDPGKALSAGISVGTISNIDIKSMDEQTAEWAANRRSDVAVSDSSGSTDSMNLAVLAVAAGDGMVAFFEEAGMGAIAIVEGGDSMNPSVGDLLSAINNAPSDNVIVLPNNKNIIGAAEQAAELSDKDVMVIPTRSMQSGVAAMSAFDLLNASMEENVEEMSEAIEALHVGAVFKASRDATFGGVTVEEGQFMVTVDDDAVAAGGEAVEMLISGVESVMHDGALVSVYNGADLSSDDAGKAESELSHAVSGFKNVDIHFENGGQPHYAFLFSVE